MMEVSLQRTVPAVLLRRARLMLLQGKLGEVRRDLDAARSRPMTRSRRSALNLVERELVWQQDDSEEMRKRLMAPIAGGQCVCLLSSCE